MNEEQEKELSILLESIGEAINTALEKKAGFVLLVKVNTGELEKVRTVSNLSNEAVFGLFKNIVKANDKNKRKRIRRVK